jgi:hypothetical protein
MIDEPGSDFIIRNTMISVIHTKNSGVSVPDAAFYLIPHPGFAVNLVFMHYFFLFYRILKKPIRADPDPEQRK